jgi:signal transduction histidine kinase
VEGHLRFACDHAPIAIWTTDADSMVTMSEGAGLTALGVKSGQLVGQKILEIFGAHPTIPGYIRRGLAGESFWYTAQAGEAVYHTWLTPLRGPAGEIVGLTGLSHDISELHRLQQTTIRNDRVMALGTLAASVAHEINNPLAYVRLNLEMAERRAEGEDAELRKSLALAREGTDHALHIVRDLKLLSRANDDRNEPIDVHALLDSTLALAQGAIASKARLVRRYDPAPFAFGPRARLAQVFLNLLSNASDAIAEGSPSSNVIRATTSTDPMGRAIVEIFDSGCGVPPEIVHRVFDAFFTTKPMGIGTGLGLSICHRIVGELGGELSFESSPGATTFRVALPPAP